MGTTAQKLSRLRKSKQEIMKGVKDIGGIITDNTTFREGVQQVVDIYDYYNDTSTTLTPQEKNNKTDYLKETKRLYKEAINLFEEGITDNTPLNEYKTKLDNIYNDLPKVTEEGSSITLTSIKPGLIQINSLKGDTFQQTTTGKNSFGGYTRTVNTNGVEFKYLGNGTISAEGEATSNAYSITPQQALDGNKYNTVNAGTYTISKDSSEYDISVFNDDKTEILTLTTTTLSGTITLSAATKIIIRMKIKSGAKVNLLGHIQLEEGSSATSYEPYTGNTIAPNPNYPQTVQTVTGNQTLIRKGKNLFNKNTIISGKRLGTIGQIVTDSGSTNSFVSDFIPVKGSTFYTKNSPTADAYHRYACYSSNNENSFLSYNNNQTYKVPADTKYIRFTGYLDELNTTQLEQGSTSTTYESYNEIVKTFNLGNIELCKIGNYQDIIFKNTINNAFYNASLDEGCWYKYGMIRKYNNFDDSSISILTNTYKILLKPRASLHDMISTTNTATQGLAKTSIVTTSVSNVNPSAIRYNYGWGGLAVIYGSDTRALIGEKTEKELSNWMNANEVIYVVIDTTYDYIDYTKITDATLIEQLEEINNIYSTDEATTISINGNLPIIINASALQKNS